jgi:hypothetical protein
MSNIFRLLVAILLLSACALAQATCEYTYSSGTGDNATQFCVTNAGTIGQFSVQGEEFIEVPVAIEGYGLCDSSTLTGYTEYTERSQGWLTPSLSQNGNVVTVTRETNDGIWQLKQTITNIPATATAPASVKMAMAVKNLSGSNRNVSLIRFVATNIYDTQDDYDFTYQTAYMIVATNDTNRGFSSINNTYNSAISNTAFTQTTFEGPDPCNAGASVAPQPYVGGGGGGLVQFWNYNAAHGSSKTMTATYSPI